MLRPGEVLGGRFEIDTFSKAGGMGWVFLARDVTTGERVAVKVSRDGVDPVRRLQREAHILSRVSHPCVVGYVAHGATGEGPSFLAMEWLDGEDLASLLARGPLPVHSAIAVGVAIAGALDALHRSGVVHRDVKPANVFLVGGSLERIKLLDFGIARVTSRRDAIEPDDTQRGAMMGTPGYMPPEQAHGVRDVDGRADLFALGALLFRCVAGRGPFVADADLTVLLRSVLEDAPRLADLAPAVPEALDGLVARLLARAADDRPRDARTVATELYAVMAGGAGPASGRTSRTELGTTERRLVCLVLARSQTHERHDETLTTDEASARRAAFEDLARRHGGALHVLVDGSVVIAFAGDGAAPTDLAARGARCALAIEASWPGVPVGLVAARGVPDAAIQTSEVIPRAVALLARPQSAAPRGVRVDRVTAGLLGAAFEIDEDGDSLVVRREREQWDPPRTLLGRPTPCVGRQREITFLEGLVDDAIAESAARVALVTGPAGAGKSRLVHEFRARLRARGDSSPEVWIGRAEPVATASPLSLIRAVVASGLHFATGVEAQATLDVVLRDVGDADRERIREFVTELCAIPSTVRESRQLAAARRDPILMADQTRRAFEDLVSAAAAKRPLVVVLEDLHWSDAASLDLLDSALRTVSKQPWVVLGVARPEMLERLGTPWRDRDLQHVHLAHLSRRASVELVRHVLGDAPEAAVVDALVERAGGNAFYLEELIRATAEGGPAGMPETVVAMAQARLDRVHPDARRVLRAASVFGTTFWTAGVSSLLGQSGATAPEWLSLLADQELVARQPSSRLGGQQELVFRHALVHEAAYATLTEGDRALGHLLAATWLEKTGETDPVVLADHFELGGQPARAAAHWLAAARRALGANDFAAAGATARRGAARAEPGRVRAALRTVEAEAHRWRGEMDEALEAARTAVDELGQGDAVWPHAVAELAVASSKLGHVERVRELAGSLFRAFEEGSVGGAHVVAAARVAAQLLYAGSYESADALLDAAEGRADESEPTIVARLLQARAMRALFAGDPATYLQSSAASVDLFEQGGDVRNACFQRSNVGYGLMEVGRYEEAVAELSRALKTADQVGLSSAATYARHNLGLALARVGRLDEALSVELAACEAVRAQGDRRVQCTTRIYLALVHLERGELDAALADASEAVSASSQVRPLQPMSLGVLARVHLALGDTTAALTRARDAHGALVELGAIEDGEALVRLAYAESLLAERSSEAGDALGVARDRLLARAAKISDAALRASFLENVPENARTMELAARVIDGSGDV